MECENRKNTKRLSLQTILSNARNDDYKKGKNLLKYKKSREFRRKTGKRFNESHPKI